MPRPLVACECGRMRSARASRCRPCHYASLEGGGVNNLRHRPDILKKIASIRKECPLCGRVMRPPNLVRHIRAHDLWRLVDASGDCWEWTGCLNHYGYGQAVPAVGPREPAHRWAWRQLVGEIPAGLVLDHLCRNRTCVNPDHLEPVSIGENTRRGYSPGVRRMRGHLENVA